ncbi:28570_t:CDS:2 [Gigaspora margarita]|uniref:28570_t:CDS:1 n=1 Tax=Gigaspora margarita TaxID=4874 RepID=A0ABN7V5F3_GIGMA|nr:28570_t:CDS:2 [Gigaspora margarita]
MSPKELEHYHCLTMVMRKIYIGVKTLFVAQFCKERIIHVWKDISENTFNKALDNYLKNEPITNILVKQLSLPLKFYEWALTNFGVDSQITERCFEDILRVRANINSTNNYYQSTFSNLNAKINRDRHILEEWNQALHSAFMSNINNSTNAFRDYLRGFIDLC